MKKLMIVAALAFTAVAANASNFKWGLLSGTLDTTKVDKGTAYLCYYTGSTANWATELAKLTAFDAATITGTMGMQVVKVGDSSTFKKTDADATFAYDGVSTTKSISKQTYISGDCFGDGTSTAGSFYYVVIDDGGKDIAYTTTAQTATINTGTGTTTKTVASSKFSYATAASGDIPEPTSAMLILLGMAGLALRRRRA